MVSLTAVFEKLIKRKKASALPAPELIPLPAAEPQMSPLQATSTLLALADAFRLGNIDPANAERQMQEILAAAANAKAQTGNGETALFRVCGRDGSEKLAEMLIAAGADVNQRLGDGDAPILRAAEAAAPETMRVLLDAGADATAIKTEKPRLDFGDFAIGGGKRDVFYYIVVNRTDEKPEKLAARTASLKLMLDRGHAPDSELSFIYSSKWHLQPLFPGIESSKKLDEAITMRDANRVKHLLAGGLNPDCAAAFNHDTALFEAVTKGDTDIMGLLLDAGADINVVGKNCNLTPLQRAVWADHAQAFDYLLDRGADPAKLGRGTGNSILSMAEANPPMLEHIKTSLARHQLTLQKPVSVSKPLRLKLGSSTL